MEDPNRGFDASDTAKGLGELGRQLRRKPPPRISMLSSIITSIETPGGSRRKPMIPEFPPANCEGNCASMPVFCASLGVPANRKCLNLEDAAW
jgi:hypothetical protein